MPLKSTFIEYILCGVWGASGATFAMIFDWMPTPEEASRAFMVGLISAGGGLLLRYVWGKIQKKWDL